MTKENNFSSPIVLFKSALVFYRRHFKIIVYLLALPILLRVIVEILRFEGFKISLFVIGIVTVIVNIFAQISYIYLIADEGKSTVKDYLKKSWQIFWPFVWVMILTALATLGATILLIIPGIIVGVFLAFSSFLVITEEKYGAEALRASWRYVKGRWWHVFGYLVFLISILLAVLVAVSIVASLVPSGNSDIAGDIVSAIISGLILSPVGVVYLFSLYKELKAAKNAEL